MLNISDFSYSKHITQYLGELVNVHTLVHVPVYAIFFLHILVHVPVYAIFILHILFKIHQAVNS